MTKEETLAVLDKNKISYEVENHIAVYTIEEMIECGVSHPELIAKNLFVCDDKKRNFYLLTVRDDCRVDLKAFGQKHGLKRLRFAPEEKLTELTGLTRGAVSPLGLLADEGCKVVFFIDRYFMGKKIGVHPCDNTATVWLNAGDLVKLIKKHGNDVTWVDD